MSATHSGNGLPGLQVKEASAASWWRSLKARTDWLRSRFAPTDPVLVLRPDGSRAIWIGNAQVDEPDSKRKPKFTAIEIPDELVLRRRLLLPKISQADSDEAILLEVRSNSPFAPEDLVWGCIIRGNEDGQRRAEIVIASRRHISEFVQARWPEFSSGDQPEMWAVAGLPEPVVITGYGEQSRLRHAQSQRRWDWVLLFVACALGSLAAMTPTVQLRSRAMEAADAFQVVVKRVAPLVRKRDEIALLNDRLRSLEAAVADRVDPAQVLEYLTQILPDDTHLFGLEIRKAKITASGHTTDASALLQKLSSDTRLRDVRSPTAVTRVPGATKEAFTVEFTMEMRQAAVGTPPVAGTGASGVATAAPTAPAAPIPASPKTTSSSPFVIGGSSR